RVGLRTKEVTEAKTLFRAMKSAIETLAKKSDDPSSNLEMGQFLCFAKGNWDLGLRFLIKGSDAVLKPLAEKELALPTSLADRAAIADAWADLADKEKSPLRKTQMASHARSIYESVLNDSTGLLKARIEKKMGELGSVLATKQAPIDLLKLVDPGRDAVAGQWKLADERLITPAVPSARLQLPYIPPEE